MEKTETLETLRVLAELLEVVQKGYVKPDQSKHGSNNTTGVIRDAKDAKPTYHQILDKINEQLEKL